MAYQADNYLLELKESNEQLPDESAGFISPLISNNSSKLLALSITSSPLFKIHNLIIKRLFDIIISVIVITLLLWWVLPLLALLIKIDSSGPIFFIQKRNKKNGRLFHCLKLRTMRVNADADMLTSILNDNRITGLGKFLRLSHLD